MSTLRRLITGCICLCATFFRPQLHHIWYGPPVPILATARGGGGGSGNTLLKEAYHLYSRALNSQWTKNIGLQLTRFVTGGKAAGTVTLPLCDTRQGAGHSSRRREINRGELGSSLSSLFA